ncbi:MAG: outer membrane beta-barrel protein [Alphaproteobacteria bacterium]|nr:outer membrane beta-barrel protein [Alphaproteobacteria bacterium]
MKFKYVLFALLFIMPSFAGGDLVDSSFLKNPYVGFNAGFAYTLSTDNRFETSNTEDAAEVAFVIGGELSHNWRVEFEANYNTKFEAKISTGLKKQEFESFAGLLNLYRFWDFRNSDKVQPFIFGGFGFAYNIADDYQTSNNLGIVTSYIKGDKSLEPAYQFGTGVSLKVNDYSSFDFSLRYLNRGSADTTNIQVASGIISTATKEKATIKSILGVVGIRVVL